MPKRKRLGLDESDQDTIARLTRQVDELEKQLDESERLYDNIAHLVASYDDKARKMWRKYCLIRKEMS